MAKVPFTKLGLSKMSTEFKVLNWNDQNIEIKQYLPINDKLAAISNVLNNSADDNNFANPVKVEMYVMLEMVFNYTNINFTDKQKEDLVKLYDIMHSTGFLNAVKENIPEIELNNFMSSTWTCINAYYNYINSVYGVLDAMKTDYNNLDFDITSIQEKISNGENVEFLKEVLTKLG